MASHLTLGPPGCLRWGPRTSWGTGEGLTPSHPTLLSTLAAGEGAKPYGQLSERVQASAGVPCAVKRGGPSIGVPGPDAALASCPSKAITVPNQAAGRLAQGHGKEEATSSRACASPPPPPPLMSLRQKQ